jgi:hypothetical protein
MEVHAHTHTARKKWTHYFWEFLMLFLAVFCGFLAEYQLEHKIEKQRAKEFALSLYRDITTDTLTFITNIQNLNTSIRKIDSLITLLGHNEEIEKNVKDIYRFSLYAFIFPSNKPNRSTIQQLLNSGALRYFRSNQLIDSVKEYNKEIELYEDFRQDIGNINIDFRKAQARILEINPLINTIAQNNFFNPEKMYHDLLTLPDNIHLFTTEPLPLKEYANWCALKIFYMHRTVQHFQRLKTCSKAVLRLLKEQYNFK